jgi:hypothetical protein
MWKFILGGVALVGVGIMLGALVLAGILMYAFLLHGSFIG